MFVRPTFCFITLWLTVPWAKYSFNKNLLDKKLMNEVVSLGF